MSALQEMRNPLTNHRKLTEEQVLVLLALEPGLSIADVKEKMLVPYATAYDKVKNLELSGRIEPNGEWPHKWFIIEQRKEIAVS